MFHHYEGDSIRFSVVPPPALTSLAPPPPIHCTSLPVWPSTRLLWPPPRSMCTSGSSGPAELRSGVCCSARVPRSRREGHDQHVGPRHGPCTWGEPHGRRTTSRGCCGRPQFVLWSPVGHRHYVDVSCARRRTSEAPARKGGLDDAKARKEVTYPELVGEGSRAKLVVLAAEVGGRWSAEVAQFIRALTTSKAVSALKFMQASVAHAWCHRLRRLSACFAAKAFAGSLLEHRSPVSAAGVVPSVHDVIRDGLHMR